MDANTASRCGSRSGMTLIEIMIASGLLLLFLTAATGVLVSTTHALDLVRQRTTAAALAWSRIERARFMDFAMLPELAEGPPGMRIDASGVPDEEGRFRRRTFVNITTNGLPLANLRVQVWSMDRRSGDFRGDPETVETVIAQIEWAGEPQ